MPRQQLSPQIKKITLKNGKVRYHVKENGRVDSIAASIWAWVIAYPPARFIPAKVRSRSFARR